MTIDNFNKKIVLISSALILSNFFLLTISVTELFVKINYVLFLSVIVLYYFKNILDNWYLKIFFLLIILIALGTPAFEWDARSIWLFHAKKIFYQAMYPSKWSREGCIIALLLIRIFSKVISKDSRLKNFS